jgi:hypothetical protein
MDLAEKSQRDIDTNRSIQGGIKARECPFKFYFHIPYNPKRIMQRLFAQRYQGSYVAVQPAPSFAMSFVRGRFH